MADIFDNSSLLMFRVGPVYCCAPSFPVESIIQPPEMTRTPGSNTAHPGLFKHSGNMVSGLDLRYQFGVDEQDWTKPGRMIIAGVDAGVIGFWVDQIIEVMQMPKTGWGSLPPLLPRGIFTRTLLFKDKIYLFSEFEKLFSIPTSGYLRPYIEHLIEIEQKAQQKSAVGQASSFTNSNFSANRSAISSNAVGSTSNSKPTGHKHSKSDNNNVLPLCNKETSTRSESNPEKITTTPKSNPSVKPNQTSDQNSITGKLERDTTDKMKLQETSERPKSIKSSQLQTASAQKSSSQRKILETNVQQQSKTGQLSQNKQPVNNQKPLETRAPLNQVAETTRRSAHLHQSSVEKKTGLGKNKPDATPDLTPGMVNSPSEQPGTNLQHKPIEPNTTIPSSKAIGDDSSVWPMIVLLLFMVGIGAGTFWYLTQEPKKTPPRVSDSNRHEKTQPASSGGLNSEVTQSASLTESTSVDKTTMTSVPESDAKKLTTNTTTVVPEQSQPGENNQETIEHEPSDTKPEVASAPTTKVTEPPSQTEITATDYKADIVQDQDGITIILDTPDDVPIFKAPELDEQPNEPTETEAATNKLDKVVADANDELVSGTTEIDTIQKISVSDQTDKAATTTTQNRAMEPVTRQQITEIIHIVKKGDTLWHIAIRYVNNPYRYPELARLSNIKNPDLIYPGNRVRIIKRRKIEE